MSTNDQPIRIVIADDHEIFRQGFIAMLKKEKSLMIVGEAADGEELIDLVGDKKPDLVFTDIMMPNMDGIAATKIIRKKYLLTKVIALSMFNDDNLIMDMLEAGASGYLLKNTTLGEVFMAANVVNKGEEYFCNDTSRRLLKLIAGSRYNPKIKKGIVKFSGRELEIVQLMCEQLTIKEIAEKLDLSPRTVENYREVLLEKTASKNAVGIILYAIKNNIISI